MLLGRSTLFSTNADGLFVPLPWRDFISFVLIQKKRNKEKIKKIYANIALLLTYARGLRHSGARQQFTRPAPAGAIFSFLRTFAAHMPRPRLQRGRNFSPTVFAFESRKE